MNFRILLCRPQGGLNDILCQIEKCCRYAEQYGRTVVVDTAYVNSLFFKDQLDRYFTSKQSRLILSVNNISVNLHELRTYPEFINGRLDSYESYFENKYLAFCDKTTGIPITFNFNQDYPHPLLVHHQCGGGKLAQFALLRVSLKSSLVDQLTSRMKTVAGSWVGVHVRNTDYSTNYESLLQGIKMTSSKRIYLATDSLQVKERFQAELKDRMVYSMARVLSSDAKPIHEMHNHINNDVYILNCDAILDLLMLAFSVKLVFEQLEINHNNAKLSGFSVLAYNLWSNKIILKYLVNNNRINFGLD